MQRSATSILLRYFFVDVLLDVVRFPVWWYTAGAVGAGRWYLRTLGNGLDRLAIPVLLKNLGRPMFGDYTREGRLVSFFVRIVQLIVSLLLFLLWWAVVTALLLGYVLLLSALVWLAFEVRPHG